MITTFFDDRDFHHSLLNYGKLLSFGRNLSQQLEFYVNINSQHFKLLFPTYEQCLLTVKNDGCKTLKKQLSKKVYDWCVEQSEKQIEDFKSTHPVNYSRASTNEDDVTFVDEVIDYVVNHQPQYISFSKLETFYEAGFVMLGGEMVFIRILPRNEIAIATKKHVYFEYKFPNLTKHKAELLKWVGDCLDLYSGVFANKKARELDNLITNLIQNGTIFEIEAASTGGISYHFKMGDYDTVLITFSSKKEIFSITCNDNYQYPGLNLSPIFDKRNKELRQFIVAQVQKYMLF